MKDTDAVHRIAWRAASEICPKNPERLFAEVGGGAALVSKHIDDHEWIWKYADKALRAVSSEKRSGRGGSRRGVIMHNAAAVAWLCHAYHEATGKHPSFSRTRRAEAYGRFIEFCELVLPLAGVKITPNAIASYVQKLRANTPLRTKLAYIYEAPLDA